MSRRSAVYRFLPLLAMGLVLTATACSTRRTTFLERVVQLGVGELLSAEPGEAPAPPSRARLDQFPNAMMALSRPDAPGAGFVVPVADNDGLVTYQDFSRRSVVMKGGLLTATLGFNYDLAAIRHQDNDPVARPTPVAEWPRTLVRNYQFTLQSADDFQITVTCVLDPVVRERIEIFELFYDVARIQERCANTRRKFTNTYWVVPETGFIWKSEQWIGPKVTPFTIEIIRRYIPA